MIIHEPDVAITDLILFIESILFAWLFYKQTSNHFLLRKLLILLFLSLGASSFIGALFHAFFPAKATTAEGFIVWILVAFSRKSHQNPNYKTFGSCRFSRKKGMK